jgi:hypothetical protein
MNVLPREWVFKSDEDFLELNPFPRGVTLPRRLTRLFDRRGAKFIGACHTFPGRDSTNDPRVVNVLLCDVSSAAGSLRQRRHHVIGDV